MSSLSKSIDRVPFKSLITPTMIFLVSTIIVNGGNYGYNVVLGRLLTPAQFSLVGLMVTLLLVASFVAMTFQIVAIKFTVESSSKDQSEFRSWFSKFSLRAGCYVAVVLAIFSGEISIFFHLPNSWSILVFAATMPLFFLMSVKRGFLQGRGEFTLLSGSYQAEMWGRAIFTLALLLLVNWSIDLQISVAILASVAIGYLAINEPTVRSKVKFELLDRRKVYQFLGLTAGYEGAQILINYSDILIVKHYFDEESAGLYTSMALIGRMIYFMTWMVVMILIPKVLKLRKEGKNHRRSLLTYFSAIASFSMVLVSAGFLFSEDLVVLLFGSAYLPVAPLLWQYGFATMLFALANVMVYYFLSLDHQLPVFIAIFFGCLQVVLFFLFHESLVQMIRVQIINMSVLLLVMLAYFTHRRV